MGKIWKVVLASMLVTIIAAAVWHVVTLEEVRMDNQHESEVLRTEIRKLSDKGPTARELDEAKKFLTGSYALRFDTSSKIANQLVNLQMEGFGTSYLDERNALIDAVTLGEAKRVARRLLGDGKMLVTVAGRPEGL